MNQVYARLASLCVSLLLFHFSFSQTDCGFDDRHRTLVANDSAYRNSVRKLNVQMQQLQQQRLLAPNAPLGIVYRIPVVVHVIHKGEAIGVGTNISDAQIQSAITSMSQFYRGTMGSSPDAEIEFQLATIDPSCSPSTGIVRIDGSSVTNYSTDGLVTGGAGNEVALKNLSRWPADRYYNIWIVSEVNNNNGGGGIQGFAYFPTTPEPYDGAVILFNAFGYDPTNTLGYNLKTATDENKTAIHELGHAFGLYHSFEGDDSNGDNVADQCPANANCLMDGDEVCDTDPHRRSLSNCPTGPNVCGGILDNTVKNFMDYSSAACQDRFTLGQVTRMRDMIGLYRYSLTISHGVNQAYPSPYSPPTAACSSVTGPVGLANDIAGINILEMNGRNFESLTPGLDNAATGYLNWTTNCHNLLQLMRGGTYQLSTTVFAANQTQLRAWIDYNNNGSFDNATEQIYLNSSIPSHVSGYVTVTATFTIPNTATVNSFLRLRIINELSTVYGGVASINGGCFNPQYGQTEDLPVYLMSTLPVVLESFTGRKVGDDVLLDWKTSLEQNAKEFEIEKSVDGVSFSKIGTVPVSSTRNYSFIDRNLIHENNYYRLRAVDIDGQFEFSKIVTIRNVAVAKVPFNVLSNPIQNNLDIQFNNDADGPVQVRLTDMTGKTLINWNGRDMSNRKLTMNIANRNLSAGVYVLHARVNGRDYTQKVVVK